MPMMDSPPVPAGNDGGELYDTVSRHLLRFGLPGYGLERPADFIELLE
jgi:hypothetical protein